MPAVSHLTRSELAAYAVCAVLIGLLGWRALHADAAAPGAASPPREASPRTGAVAVRHASATAVVHVVGAVRRPGVYRLHDGQRVRDAVRRAGGATAAADLQALNLAAKVGDAQQVVVPRRGGAAPAVGASASAPGVAAAAPVSLSSATVEQLDALDGVGPSTAQKILAYRTEHGGFRSVDELGDVPGIGPKKLEALRDRVQP